MDYFELRLSDQVKHPVRPELYGVKARMLRFEQLDPVIPGQYEDDEKLEVTDILQYPLYMISDRMRNLFEAREITFETKALQLFAKGEDPKPLLYFFIYPPKGDCMHASTRIDPNGDIRELILDAAKLPAMDIFRIEQPNGMRIIISEYVAEMLLANHFYGIALKRVRMK